MKNRLKLILSEQLPSESEILDRQLQIYKLCAKINGTNICVHLGATWRKYFLRKLPVKANSSPIHSFSLVSMVTQYHTRQLLLHRKNNSFSHD